MLLRQPLFASLESRGGSLVLSEVKKTILLNELRAHTSKRRAAIIAQRVQRQDDETHDESQDPNQEALAVQSGPQALQALVPMSTDIDDATMLTIHSQSEPLVLITHSSTDAPFDNLDAANREVLMLRSKFNVARSLLYSQKAENHNVLQRLGGKSFEALSGFAF